MLVKARRWEMLLNLSDLILDKKKLILKARRAFLFLHEVETGLTSASLIVCIKGKPCIYQRPVYLA